MADQVRVFVSHHHSPEEDVFTARLADDLKAAGADVWVDEERITSDDFIKKINEGLTGRQWLVLVMTPDALRSPWVQAEVNAALNQWRKGRMLGVVPIVAKPCADEDIPPLLDPLQRYDATRAYEPARNRLLSALGLRVPFEPSAPSAPEFAIHSVAPTSHPLSLPGEISRQPIAEPIAEPVPETSSRRSAQAQPAGEERDQAPEPERRMEPSTVHGAAPAIALHAPSGDADVTRPVERAGTQEPQPDAQIATSRPAFRLAPRLTPRLTPRLMPRQLLLLVLAITVIGGGIKALTSWGSLAAAFSGSQNPAATTTELAFQRTLFATQTAQASLLTHDYKPAGIGLCDTVDPPYGSTTEHSYWESQGTVRCPGSGVTELAQGGRVEFFGFPLGFPLAYQVSATFAFPSSEARSCLEFDVGSVGGKTVDISLCNDGAWSGSGGAARGTVSVADSYVVTISVTQTTGAVSVNGATVIPSAPLSGETYSIQIDASGIASRDALDISSFVLHPTPA